MINMINNVINNLVTGDKVYINNWDEPLEVRGVSSHYIVISNDDEYSIICKWLEHGKFYCGPDDYLLGSPLRYEYDNLYDFTNKKAINKYLRSLENEDTRISERYRVEINYIRVIHFDGREESARERREYKII